MGQRVHTLGNNEKPVLNHIAQIQKGDWVILELSSAQLWWTKKLREAALAIITSFTPNHLDWHGSLEHYRHAKIKVLHSAQKAFCPDALYEARLGDHIQPWPALLSDKAQKALEQLPDDVFYSPSRYAAINVCHIAQALEWPLECVAQAFSQWQLLEYRSQIKKHHDIYWVNDSKSTTYASTLALFDTLSYSPEESVLILGGHLKGQNPASFLPLITKVAHILLIGQSALELHAVLREHATIVGDLPGAFKHLKNMRPKPRWVILSPGAASFDQFKDYKHRGQCFWSEVDNFYD
jgi:UDP-N-acetylmuramoylalanine--D-glutamate ligase